MLTCETDLTECRSEAAFVYRWPGTLFDAHVCARHALALAGSADVVAIGLKPLGAVRLEAYQPPGSDEISHRLVTGDE